MNWHKAYTKALEMAAIAHKDAKRKFADEPYFVHPLRVSDIVLDYTGSIELACAAALHDTLEDTTLRAEEISNYLPDEVRFLVESVTKNKSLEKAAREEEYLKRFSTAPIDTVILKLADRFDNVRDLVMDSVPIHFITSYSKNTIDLLKAVPAHALGSQAVELLRTDIVNALSEARERKAERLKADRFGVSHK